MAAKRRRLTVSGVIAALLGFVCALVLCALFYGAMVYQLAGEPEAAQEAAVTGLLALSSGTLLEETTAQQEVGGALCSVTTRVYALADGAQARAITATPAAYLERLTARDVEMQLITGFVIDDLDAVYARSGNMGILAARSGDTVVAAVRPSGAPVAKSNVSTVACDPSAKPSGSSVYSSVRSTRPSSEEEPA